MLGNIFFTILDAWNSLPATIINCSTLELFKNDWWLTVFFQSSLSFFPLYLCWVELSWVFPTMLKSFLQALSLNVFVYVASNWPLQNASSSFPSDLTGSFVCPWCTLLTQTDCQIRWVCLSLQIMWNMQGIGNYSGICVPKIINIERGSTELLRK